MLDRTRDTHGEVEIRTNRFTGLSDLSLVCENTCIDHRTRSRYFGTEHVGKLAQGLEPFCRADTAAARNEYFGLRNVDHILLFLDRFQNPYAELRFVEIDFYILDLSFAGRIGRFGTHHTGAYRGHLGTMFLADDRCHQVTAEGRTRHQQVAVFRNVESGTVGGKSRADACRKTRTEVAADAGGTDQQNAGLALVDYLGDGLCVRLGGVLGEFVGFDRKDHVGSGCDQLVGLVFDSFAEQQGDYLLMECVGQFAGFSQKFESDVLNDSVTLFDEHVNVFILRFIHLGK